LTEAGRARCHRLVTLKVELSTYYLVAITRPLTIGAVWTLHMELPRIPRLPLPLLLVALATSGCAVDFARQTRSTGEPLTARATGNTVAFRQGDVAIDEHDYYRISGDQAHADHVRARRDRGILANRVGIASAIAGAVLMGAGISAGNSSVMGGGALLLPIGGVTMFWGKSTAEKVPQVRLQDAQIAGDRYNARVAQ